MENVVIPSFSVASRNMLLQKKNMHDLLLDTYIETNMSDCDVKYEYGFKTKINKGYI